MEILTLMLCVPTDEDEDDDNIEIDTNEEAPECSVTGGGDELTNLENDLDSTGNLNNGYFVYFAWLTLHHHINTDVLLVSMSALFPCAFPGLLNPNI